MASPSSRIRHEGSASAGRVGAKTPTSFFTLSDVVPSTLEFGQTPRIQRLDDALLPHERAALPEVDIPALSATQTTLQGGEGLSPTNAEHPLRRRLRTVHGDRTIEAPSALGALSVLANTLTPAMLVSRVNEIKKLKREAARLLKEEQERMHVPPSLAVTQRIAPDAPPAGSGQSAALLDMLGVVLQSEGPPSPSTPVDASELRRKITAVTTHSVDKAVARLRKRDARFALMNDDRDFFTAGTRSVVSVSDRRDDDSPPTSRFAARTRRRVATPTKLSPSDAAHQAQLLLEAAKTL